MLKIHHADVVRWALAYQGPRFHGSLSDPPYHLTEIVKRFGKPGAKPARDRDNGAGPYARTGKGFMGRTWDGGDLAFHPETWSAIASPLYPGAFGMAFAGSRGWHRMAAALEGYMAVPWEQLRAQADMLALARETRDWSIVEAVETWIRNLGRIHEALDRAGLIIHPTIFGWVYGSGFPKATKPADQLVARKFRAWLLDHPAEAGELRAARQELEAARGEARGEARRRFDALRHDLQERAGLTRRAGQRRHAPKFDAAAHGYRQKDNGFNSKDHDSYTVVEYLDPEAAALAGHRYGLQALKPAMEPVIVWQKRHERAPIEEIAATGAGALWIDGGRIEATDSQLAEKYWSTRNAPPRDNMVYGRDERARQDGPLIPHEGGRWPANFAMAHRPDCGESRCAPGCVVAALAEQSGDSTSTGGSGPGSGHLGYHGADGSNLGQSAGGFGDTGGADRFFFAGSWELDILEAEQAAYIPKPSSAEKEAGLDPLQVALMRELYGDDLPNFDPVTVDDGREIPIDNAYLRGETTRRNIHPTIKPLTLARWLATLLLPPARYGPRRLLVPFAGTGSEMIGGMLAGWDEVEGVELTEDHIPIAEARFRFWEGVRHKFDRGQPIKLTAPTKPKRRKGGPVASQLSILDAPEAAALEAPALDEAA